MINLFGITLGLLEIFVFVIIFLGLVAATSADRRGWEGPKWWLFGLALIILAGWFWKDWTFAGLWATLRSWSFWEPVLAYLGFGVLYSCLEFGLEIKRCARECTDQWRAFVASKSPRTENERIDASAEFISKYNLRWNRLHKIVELERVGEAPEPKINKSELAQSIGAWTFLWPAYFVSLIIGDLLTEIFEWISSLIVRLSGRFVRYTFRDVFKF